MFCQTFDSTTFRECSLTPETINYSFANMQWRNVHLSRWDKGHYRCSIGPGAPSSNFQGKLTFYESKGSALAVRETVVQVMLFTSLNFTRNTGRNGGGIAFMGNSWMVLYEDTHVIFDSNPAVERGGAIYAAQLLNCYLACSYSCFICYVKPGEHPDDWIATLYFRNNSEFAHGPAKHSNSIYASSILPCMWPSSQDSDIKSDINATFCDWNSWKFDSEGNCTADITSCDNQQYPN